MITEEQVRRIAELAKLEFTNEEISAFTQDFGRILEYVETIEKLDLEGVEPLVQVSDMENVLRDDVVGESLPAELALKNAPKRNESFFKVPKVLG